MSKPRSGWLLVAAIAAAGCGAHHHAPGLSAEQRADANALCRAADRRIAAGRSTTKQYLTAANLQAIIAEVNGLQQLHLGKPLAAAIDYANQAIGDATDAGAGPQDALADMVTAKAEAARVGINCSFGVQLFGG